MLAPAPLSLFTTARFGRVGVLAACGIGLMRVAIAIPAYDAAASVGAVVAAARQQLPDVLVIDDGSRDGTAEQARAAGAEVRVLPANGGKGSALGVAFGDPFCRAVSMAW